MICLYTLLFDLIEDCIKYNNYIWLFIVENYYDEEVSCDCPTPCREVKYEFATAQARFPNNYFDTSLRTQLGITDKDTFM